MRANVRAVATTTVVRIIAADSPWNAGVSLDWHLSAKPYLVKAHWPVTLAWSSCLVASTELHPSEWCLAQPTR